MKFLKCQKIPNKSSFVYFFNEVGAEHERERKNEPKNLALLVFDEAIHRCKLHEVQEFLIYSRECLNVLPDDWDKTMPSDRAILGVIANATAEQLTFHFTDVLCQHSELCEEDPLKYAKMQDMQAEKPQKFYKYLFQRWYISKGVIELANLMFSRTKFT